jgi:Domain of unknown function (DUF4340)
MQSRGLYVATAVLIILGGLWYWSQHHKPSEDASKSSAETPPAILKLDQSSILDVKLTKKGSAPILLDKNSSGEWQIAAPKPLRADQSVVSGLVGTLASLNSERLVDDKASNPAQYGLAQPALRVDVSEKNNKSQKLLIGDQTPTGGAVYAMLAGDPRVFTVASYTKTDLDKSVNDLRDKRLITLVPDKVSRVELVKKSQDIEFGRNKDEWQILKPRPLRADSTQVGDLVSQLTGAQMDVSAAGIADAGSAFAKATPVATAKLTDESGTQQLEIRKAKDDYYAKSSLVEGAYKVDSALGKAVEKNLDDFRNKSLFDFGFDTPNKIEIHNPQKSYFLTRGTAGEDDWWSSGKKVNAGSVNGVISKLRDLSATSFAQSGFSNPSIELIVTSNDGKRVEDVSIAKSGNGYIAQRKGEPTLYKLSGSAVDDLVKAGGAIHR